MFELLLPLTDRRPQPAINPPTVAEIESGSESILIVEDEPAVLNLCLDMLTDLGYRCDVAQDAAEAMRRLKSKQHYDLLFSDVVMPGGMNGIELGRRAVAQRPNLKVLLTSGYLGETARHEPHDFPLIDKPYERLELASRLREVLTGKCASAREAQSA